MSSPKPWNPKEVEDLLVSAHLPEPPADLADRIKAEIPPDVAGLERSPSTRSAGWRSLPSGQLLYLAASLATIAVAGSLAWRSLDTPRTTPAVFQPAAPPAADGQAEAEEPLTRLGRELGEASRHLEAARQAHEEARAQVASAQAQPPARESALSALGYAGSPASVPAPEPEVARPAPAAARLAAPVLDAAAASERGSQPFRQEAALAAVAPARPVLVGRVGGTGYVETRSEPLSVLGMAAEGASFSRARHFVDRGLLPPQEEVDVAAFVNAVELSPLAAEPPSGRLDLEVEGAPPVFAVRGDRRLLRVSLRGHGEPAEMDVRVELNPKVVSRWHLLTQGSPGIDPLAGGRLAGGPVGGSSGRPVTALYELELVSRPMPTETLATVYLRYREKDGERPVRRKRIVHLADFAPTWQEASTGMRLASLAAELGELLRRTGGSRSADSGEISRRARQLATELVGRSDAVELAALAGKVADLLSGVAAEEPRM